MSNAHGMIQEEYKVKHLLYIAVAMSKLTYHNAPIVHPAFQYCVALSREKTWYISVYFSILCRTSVTGHLPAVFRIVINHDVRSFHKLSTPPQKSS